MTEEMRTSEDLEQTTGTPDGLSSDELEAQGGEELPDREATSLSDADIAAPVNAAVAANVLSGDSIAYANAEQNVDIDQSNE